MRLIDADELKRKLKETAPGLKWIFNEIDNAPTISRPKTGHWIKIFLTDTSDIDGQCSECGFIHKFIDGHTAQYNYCPNCRTKMVEPQESEGKK